MSVLLLTKLPVPHSETGLVLNQRLSYLLKLWYRLQESDLGHLGYQPSPLTN